MILAAARQAGFAGPLAKFLKSVVYAWNLMCVRHLNLPRLAYHNIFIYRKKENSR